MVAATADVTAARRNDASTHGSPFRVPVDRGWTRPRRRRGSRRAGFRARLCFARAAEPDGGGPAARSSPPRSWRARPWIAGSPLNAPEAVALAVRRDAPGRREPARPGRRCSTPAPRSRRPRRCSTGWPTSSRRSGSRCCWTRARGWSCCASRSVPGEPRVRFGEGDVPLVPDRERRTIAVTNTGERPIRISSHFPFWDANPSLAFDREPARGLPSGPAGGRLAALGAGRDPRGHACRARRHARCLTGCRREEHALRHGPTAGDRVRLADTDLWIRIEERPDRARRPGAVGLREELAFADDPARRGHRAPASWTP